MKQGLGLLLRVDVSEARHSADTDSREGPTACAGRSARAHGPGTLARTAPVVDSWPAEPALPSTCPECRNTHHTLSDQLSDSIRHTISSSLPTHTPRANTATTEAQRNTCLRTVIVVIVLRPAPRLPSVPSCIEVRQRTSAETPDPRASHRGRHHVRRYRPGRTWVPQYVVPSPPRVRHCLTGPRALHCGGVAGPQDQEPQLVACRF
jgi:hypothetical protein